MDSDEDLLRRVYTQATGRSTEGMMVEHEDGIMSLMEPTLSDGSPRQNDGLDENRELLIALERTRSSQERPTKTKAK